MNKLQSKREREAQIRRDHEARKAREERRAAGYRCCNSDAGEDSWGLLICIVAFFLFGGMMLIGEMILKNLGFL